MKECPKCHTQYDDSMNFCTNDGCQLVDTTVMEAVKYRAAVVGEWAVPVMACTIGGFYKFPPSKVLMIYGLTFCHLLDSFRLKL